MSNFRANHPKLTNAFAAVAGVATCAAIVGGATFGAFAGAVVAPAALLLGEVVLGFSGTVAGATVYSEIKNGF